MRGVCPICGKEVGAVKNHVRMTSGDGHGRSGEYPEYYDLDAGQLSDAAKRALQLQDLFEAEDRAPDRSWQDILDADRSSEDSPDARARPRDGVPDRRTAESGSGRGSGSAGGGIDLQFDSVQSVDVDWADRIESRIGRTATTAEDGPSESDAPAGEPEVTDAGTAEACPVCGGPLERPEPGNEFVRGEKRGFVFRRHKRIETRGSDRVCLNCDLLVRGDGTVYTGRGFHGPIDRTGGS